MDVPHPEDDSRSFISDLSNMMSDLQTKIKNSSTPKQYLRSDVFKIISQLRNEYGSHQIENDRTGKLLDGLVEDLKAQIDPLKEAANIPLE